MAFNPFHWFRKRQRTLLAGLAIFTMFLFVLQFGQGDALETFLQWMGAGRVRKDQTPVATLNGQTWKLGDLVELRQDRQLAHTFMMGSLDQARQEFSADITSTVSKLDTADRFPLENVLRNWQTRATQPVPNVERARLDIQNDLRTASRAHQNLMRANSKENQAKAIAKLIRFLELDMWRFATQGTESYFGGSLTTEGLLDFTLWRDKADKLGIALAPDDLRRQISEESLLPEGPLTGDEVKDLEKVRKFVGANAYPFPKMDRFYKLMADEFRVRLAHEALSGVQPGARAFMVGGMAGNESPAHLTPEQFYQAYKENRTELNTVMMAVPVQDHLAKVTQKPTEEELQTLYRRYKEVEPTPDRDKPAFREPRRIRLEYIAASPDAPFYAHKSAEVAAELDLLRPLAVLGAVETVGGAPSAALPLFLLAREAPGLRKLGEEVAKAKDEKAKKEAIADYVSQVRLDAEYEAYVNSVRNWLRDEPSYMDGTRPSAVGSLERPENAAAAVAQLLASGATAPSMATEVQVVLAMRGATWPGLKDLTTRVAEAALAGSVPLAGPLTAAAESTALFTRPVYSEADIRGWLVHHGAKRYTEDLVRLRVDEFRKGLEGKSAREAAEYVAREAVPEKGITRRVSMPKAVDFFELDKSPVVAALKEPYQRSFLFMMLQSGPPPLAAYLFRENKPLYRPYGEEFEQFIPGGSTFLFSGSGSSRILAWKTEDQKAYTPSFDEAKPKVEAAWRLQKARELAHKEAEAIAQAAMKKRDEGGDAARWLRDEQVRHGGTVFDVLTIAKLVKSMHPLAGLDTDYESFRFPETQIAYPRPGTVDILMEKLKKTGDATVFSDRPEKTYYVAVLTNRTEPTLSEFYKVYEDTRTTFGVNDLLWRRFERERQEKFLADLLKNLRAEAKAPLDNNGLYVIDADIRKRVEGRSADSGE